MNDITTLHPEYTERLPQWTRCRDFIAGADKLRLHDTNLMGELGSYIERLSTKQSTLEYNSYIRRALYDNTVRRIRNSFLGLIFSKEPEIEIPAGIQYFEDDTDLKETPVEEFIEVCVNEVLSVGRCGVLVDRPSSDASMSQLEAEAMGIRPYFSIYKAENITNWKESRIGNKYMLSTVVVKESDERYRELLLVDRVYTVNTYSKEGGEYVLESTIQPVKNGMPITEIPFYFLGPVCGSADTVEPPLLDIVEIACSHYRSSADLEHARFSCSVPTPYFIGFNEEEVSGLALGGLNGICARDTAAKVGYLEYSGQGTEPLERALTQKYEMMARHSVDLIADKGSAEATNTVKLRVGVQTATISDMAHAISRLLSQALTFAAEWANASGEAEIELNTEYSTESMNPQEIVALMQGVIQGQLPPAVLWDRLRKVGIIPKDMKNDDIKNEIDLGNEKNTGDMLTV